MDVPKTEGRRYPKTKGVERLHMALFSPETGGKCNGVYRIHKPSVCRSREQNQRNGGERKGKSKKSKEVTISETLSEPNGNGYE